MAKPLIFNFGATSIALKYCHGVLSPSPFSKFLASVLSEHVPTLQLKKTATVLDMGSGSGVQGILLAKLGMKNVYAVDIDASCVAATEFNSLLNGVSEWTASTHTVYAHLGDMFKPLSGLKFDLIVSNPPTLPKGEATPEFADGGEYPQEFLDRLIKDSARVLKPNGRLIMTVSSLAGLNRTKEKLKESDFHCTVIRRKRQKFREFYYPHIAYYRRSKMEGIADFEELSNGELAETLCVFEGVLNSKARPLKNT